MDHFKIESIQTDNILPPKFKLRSDIGDLKELKASVIAKGLLQPLVVRPIKDKFEVVAGHRRFVVLKELGWKTIPVNIVDVDDKTALELSLTENIQRQSLDPIDEARAFKLYILEKEYGAASELAERISKSPSFITARTRLLGLPEELLTRVKTRRLGVSHAEEIARLMSKEKGEKQVEQAKELAEQVEKTGLRVEHVAKAVTAIKQGLPVSHAVEFATSFPEFTNYPKKSPERYNVIEVSRERILLTLQQALNKIDDALRYLSDTEAQVWIKRVRYPLHELIGEAQKVQKEQSK